jgi:hypothetical protein
MLFAALTVSAFAADTTVKGHLVDRECASRASSQAGFGANHTKNCLQMPPCVNSGYAVLTEDKKLIKFDDKGNEQVKKFLEGVTKPKDIKVAVTGNLNNDTITVNKIQLQ